MNQGGRSDTNKQLLSERSTNQDGRCLVKRTFSKQRFQTHYRANWKKHCAKSKRVVKEMEMDVGAQWQDANHISSPVRERVERGEYRIVRRSGES
jgi:hypothetical protein